MRVKICCNLNINICGHFILGIRGSTNVDIWNRPPLTIPHGLWMRLMPLNEYWRYLPYQNGKNHDFGLQPLKIIAALGKAKIFPDLQLMEFMLENEDPNNKLDACFLSPMLEIKDVTPIHLAAYYGVHGAIEKLRHKTETLFAKEKMWGYNPIHLAALNGHLDTVQYLVGLTEDPFTPSTTCKTPLHLATREGHFNIVTYLSGLTDNPLAVDIGGNTPIHMATRLDIVRHLVGFTDTPVTRNIFGKTPIHSAAYGGHLDILKFLQGFTSDLNAPDDNGFTPIHWAVIINSKATLDVVKYLVSFTDTPNTPSNENGGETPIYLAAKYGHLEFVEYLVDFTCAPNAANQFGITPIQIAKSSGNWHIAKFLEKYCYNHGAGWEWPTM